MGLVLSSLLVADPGNTAAECSG